MLDLLYRNLCTQQLAHTYNSHRLLSQGGKRFVSQPNGSVYELVTWPPEDHSKNDQPLLWTVQLSVIESAIEAGISDPFIWVDSNLLVLGPNAAGWLNLDLAIKEPIDLNTTQAVTNSQLLLKKWAIRHYGYGHSLPVAISHEMVSLLGTKLREYCRLSEFYSKENNDQLDLKTLLLNLDPDRQKVRPIYVDGLPVYRHIDGSVGSVIALRTLAPPLFLTSSLFSDAVLAYVQNF